jgi:hypothetical protein
MRDPGFFCAMGNYKGSYKIGKHCADHYYTGDIDANPEPVPLPGPGILLGSGLVIMMGGGRVLREFMAWRREV